MSDDLGNEDCRFTPRPVARRYDPLPADLKELVSLCRRGNLFAVQAWIGEGRRYLAPEGKFSTWPFRAAFDTGFHSLIEVFLRAGMPQAERDRGLSWAVSSRRLDLVELLDCYGADFCTISVATLVSARGPAVLRWFIKRGLDLETSFPITRALMERHREFLGIYMTVRDTVPSARTQAAMALRVHAREGNMKWVSLLLWAGVDPRLQVPDIRSHTDIEEFSGSAMEDAVISSKTEVVRKFGVKEAIDDPSRLLGLCWLCNDPALVQFLLDAGADPNARIGEINPMCSLMSNFRRALDPVWRSRGQPAAAARCLELAAKRGGRWTPSDPYEMRDLRMMLTKLGAYSATEWLQRLLAADVFGEGVFQELMKTPRMKEILGRGAPGSIVVMKAAGFRKRDARSSTSSTNEPPNCTRV